MPLFVLTLVVLTSDVHATCRFDERHLEVSKATTTAMSDLLFSANRQPTDRHRPWQAKKTAKTLGSELLTLSLILSNVL
jgi:hypothetical protein